MAQVAPKPITVSPEPSAIQWLGLARNRLGSMAEWLPSQAVTTLIITITDHDCTKAVILVPCQEKIDAEGVAKLFKDQVFPFVGLPKKIISDRDPRFTTTFQELCRQLEVSQNLSMAYHPQMDGQLEKTNQHVETALRIYCNYQQNDRAEWLLII
jgi:hypothetical protein